MGLRFSVSKAVYNGFIQWCLNCFVVYRSIKPYIFKIALYRRLLLLRVTTDLDFPIYLPLIFPFLVLLLRIFGLSLITRSFSLTSPMV